jgi:thiol-disulfide isomerase/thioredoxin
MKTLLGLLLWTAVAVAARAEPLQGIEVGDVLPDVVLHGLNGPSSRFSEYRGQPLIINVWASWCGPCRAEMASLERLAWRDPSGRLSVIGISTDDSIEQARRFIETSRASIAHYIDRRLKLERLLGATRLPLTVLVDEHGRVVRKVYGARDWDAANARDQIDALLGTQLTQGD